MYFREFEYLYERSIGKVQEPITVKLDVNLTDHAEDRKVRHDDRVIKDDDILATVAQAMPKISNALLKDYILVGGKSFIVKNRNNSLNLVCSVKRQGPELVLKVVTIMYKPNFIAKDDDFVITI